MNHERTETIDSTFTVDVVVALSYVLFLTEMAYFSFSQTDVSERSTLRRAWTGRQVLQQLGVLVLSRPSAFMTSPLYCVCRARQI